MVSRDSAFSRGRKDLRQATHHWWRFRIPAAALTTGFAVWGALLPSNASAGDRAALAVGGTLGGALVVGSLAFMVLVATAPTRQRNEAWTELGQAPPDDDPAALLATYATWLSAKRAALPAPTMFTGFIFSDWDQPEARAKREAEEAVTRERYGRARSEVERQSRVEYHERFRAGVLAIVGKGHEQARDPQAIEDLEAVETLLLAATPVSPKDVAAFKDFAHRFAGWFKGQEIAGPPDMSEVYGAEYEDEQARDVADGVITPQEYQRKVQSFTERREWARKLRAEYQRDWRADVARQFEWARGSGTLESDDFMALVLVENPSDDDLKELVESVERMAKRL